jgi:hypothetical protein
MGKKDIIVAILLLAYIACSVLVGKLVFKMLCGCERFGDYLFYGLLSTVWLGFLLLGWILLINYINEKRDI